MVNVVRIFRAICCTCMTAPVFLRRGKRRQAAGGTLNMMKRVLVIVGCAFTLAACSSSSDWASMDALKSGPSLDTVSLESEPPGAEAKASNGQTCRTPCSLALPVDAASSVTFSLNGYQPETERLEAIQSTGEPPRLRPNPVVVELTPAAPSTAKKQAKPAKKPPARKPAVSAAPAPAPAPMTAAPAPGQSPWPTNPQPMRQ